MIKMGDTFGRWTAISDQGRLSVWCRCQCGTERCLTAGNLRRRSNPSRSCGCLTVEASRSRATHGDTRRGVLSPEWRAWAQMRARCANPAHSLFHRYGGRGISVCAEWQVSYAAFLGYVGRRPSASHSLDRIDNSGNYEPGNVRWAMPAQQANNTRRNRFLVFAGKMLTISQWARERGLPVNTVWTRISRGWTAERALTTP